MSERATSPNSLSAAQVRNMLLVALAIFVSSTLFVGGDKEPGWLVVVAVLAAALGLGAAVAHAFSRNTTGAEETGIEEEKS